MNPWQLAFARDTRRSGDGSSPTLALASPWPALTALPVLGATAGDLPLSLRTPWRGRALVAITVDGVRFWCGAAAICWLKPCQAQRACGRIVHHEAGHCCWLNAMTCRSGGC